MKVNILHKPETDPEKLSSKIVQVAVLGASGYAGLELLQLLEAHPYMKVRFAGAHSEAGRPVKALDPQRSDLQLEAMDRCPLDEVEAVLLALPHGRAQEWVWRAYSAGCTVVDLSADHRLSDPTTYERVYQVEHSHPELVAEAVYGLTEVHRQRIKQSRLIANPGCYPTSVILGTFPIKDRLTGPLIVDSKSGVSGAGRGLNRTTHFMEVSQNFKAYKVGNQHRHRAEMMEQLGVEQLLFTPHLLPVARGILSSIYVPWKADFDPHELYSRVYQNERFVRVLPPGESATLAHVVRTNRCAISLHPTDSHLIILSAIDNLVKGAAGAAIQNLNLALGLPEEAGLR